MSDSCIVVQRVKQQAAATLATYSKLDIWDVNNHSYFKA